MRSRLAGITAIATVALTVGACTSGSSPVRPSRTPARSSPARSFATSPSSTPDARPSGGTAGTGAGELRTVDIRASNGFLARAAYVYVPAAVRRDPDLRTPVLELLHGTPGGPVDWTRMGSLATIMATFAQQHGGRAPLVVIPDLNGSQRGDSECIRTASGQDVESYLTTDVVRWVRTRYRAAVGTERFWIAGLSEGGMCALMLALRYPNLYSAFGDYSGLAAPIVDGRTQAESNRLLYGRSTADRLAHDPLWLLAHRRYPGMRGWFECGRSDRQVLAAQNRVSAAATTAGLTVRVATLPGGHVWSIWRAALASTLSWLWPAR